jgi:hypothetical protein
MRRGFLGLLALFYISSYEMTKMESTNLINLKENRVNFYHSKSKKPKKSNRLRYSHNAKLKKRKNA